MSSYFNGSLQKMVSFIAQENNINVNELDKLLKEVKDDLNQNSE